MRILLITWACDTDDVSEPEIAARWVKQLAQRHEVTLFAVSKPERYGCVRSQFPNIDVIEWKDIAVPSYLERFRAIVKPWYFIYFFKARKFLKQYISKNKFDVVHHISPFAWRYPSPAAGLGIPLVRGPVAGGLRTPPGLKSSTFRFKNSFMVLRETDRMRMYLDPFLRYSYKHTDHLLVAAPYMVNFLSKLPINTSSVESEHGYITTMSRELSNNENSDDSGIVQILYVGRIITTKGVRELIKAFSKVKSIKKCHLTIIGDGDDLEFCNELITALNIVDKVSFLGWLPKNEVNEYYQKSDIFIFPSFREPSGGVLMEAMGNGLPCIVCAYGGPDYLIDNSCGIKIPPQAADDFIKQLTNALERLIENPEERKLMKKNAYIRAQNQFEWKQKLDRLNNIYLSITK